MTNGDEINEQAVKELHESARSMRTQFIRDAHLSLQAALYEQDDHLRQQQHQDSSLYYVLSDEAHLPFVGLDGQHSLSIFLQGDTAEASIGQSMQVFVPCPPDFTVDKHGPIEELAEPNFVVVKHVGSSGEVLWHVVSDEVVAPYVPDAETGVDDFVVSDLTDELILRSFAKRVEARVGVIALLREELINMTIAPQRLVTQDGAVDLTIES